MLEVCKKDTLNEYLKKMFQDPPNSQKKQVFFPFKREQKNVI